MNIDQLSLNNIDNITNNFINKSIPFILTDYVTTMPAYQNWNSNYLVSKLGSKIVSAENYSETSSIRTVKSEKMPFKEFIKKIETNKRPYYLAQCNILEEFIELAPDIQIPAFITKVPHVNLYYGPKDVGTSLHYDFNDNIYCQIKGTKKITLIDPKYKEYFSFYKSKNWSHFSKKNYERILTVLNDKIYTIELTAGNALFMPKGWLHEVKNISPTIAVSIWW